MAKEISALDVRSSSYSIDELCFTSALADEEKEKLSKIISKPQTYEKGTHIYRRGEKMNYLFAIYSGYCKDYWIDAEGNEHIHEFYFPEDILALESIPQKKYSLSAVTLSTVQLCKIPVTSLFALMNEIPGLGKCFLDVAAAKMQNDLHLLKTTNAKRRVADFLLNTMHRFEERHVSAHEMCLPMTQFEIGNFLGMAYETVSRVFHHFQDQDIIKIDHKKIHIIDVEKLKNIGVT